MRILFVADGRSPIAGSWLRHWIERGDEVHLVTTFPGERLPGLDSFHILPVAFGGMGTGGAAGPAAPAFGLRQRLRGLLRPLRYWIGPLSLPYYQKRFASLVSEIHPDLVHSLRIPFEGMLAEATPAGVPLLVSIWGNDLTLHAQGSPFMKTWTKRTLSRAQGLIADADRDLRLGREWGFSGPALVVPGGGGIHLDQIHAGLAGPGALPETIPEGAALVVNPRGSRPGSLRNDSFFQAIPRVLERFPQAFFICPGMAGEADSVRWVARLNITERTRLWPRLSQSQLWALFHRTQVYVSPSLHDGTPNSLLEAMACGCFPVVGDVESLREWITPGVNGLLVDARRPQALAEAIITALSDSGFQQRAAQENARLIAKRAEYGRCMAQADALYQKIT